MGRRKRKKVVYRRIKRLPKIFQCPNCGKKTVKTRIRKEDGMATVKCGSCGLEEEVMAHELAEPVDAFGDFIDIFYATQEYDRLKARAVFLEKNAQYSELMAVYSYLADIAAIISADELKEYAEDNDPAHIDNAEEWKQKTEHWRRLEKDTLQKLDLKELEDGILEDGSIVEDFQDEDYMEEVEGMPKQKKKKETEDIFSDPGFLEF